MISNEKWTEAVETCIESWEMRKEGSPSKHICPLCDIAEKEQTSSQTNVGALVCDICIVKLYTGKSCMKDPDVKEYYDSHDREVMKSAAGRIVIKLKEILGAVEKTGGKK